MCMYHVTFFGKTMKPRPSSLNVEHYVHRDETKRPARIAGFGLFVVSLDEAFGHTLIPLELSLGIS